MKVNPKNMVLMYAGNTFLSLYYTKIGQRLKVNY